MDLGRQDDRRTSRGESKADRYESRSLWDRYYGFEREMETPSAGMNFNHSATTVNLNYSLHHRLVSSDTGYGA